MKVNRNSIPFLFFIFRQVHIHTLKEEVWQSGIVLFRDSIYSKNFLLAGQRSGKFQYLLTYLDKNGWVGGKSNVYVG